MGTLQTRVQGILTVMNNMTLQIQGDMSTQVEQVKSVVQKTRSEVQDVVETFHATNGELHALQAEVQNLKQAQSDHVTRDELDKLANEALAAPGGSHNIQSSGPALSQKQTVLGFVWSG